MEDDGDITLNSHVGRSEAFQKTHIRVDGVFDKTDPHLQLYDVHVLTGITLNLFCLSCIWGEI